MVTYGDVCLYKKNTNPNQRGYLNLYYIDKEVVTEQLSPPLIAIRAIESVNVLKGLLLSWEQGDDQNITSTDVTDYFYEQDDKKKNRLKKDFVTGFNGIKLSVENFTGQDEIVEVCLGIDAPARNVLKHIELDDPKITVITWKESAEMYRYATIVKTKNDVGIWAGMYSNFKLITV
jgi:hypothetical protein